MMGFATVGRRLSLAAVIPLSVLVSSCGGTATPTSPGPAGSRQMSAAARSYFTQLLDVMQANSVNRKVIDWVAFRQTAIGVDSGEQTIKDLYPRIRVALSLLNDHHSVYVGPDSTVIRSPALPDVCGDPTPPAVHVPADIGYVRVGTFTGTDGDAAFAQATQDAIRAADRGNLAGWIVDLRNNGGGNMWPMVAGLGPILGDGTAGGFIDPDGVRTWWGYRDNASIYEGSPLVTVTSPYHVLKANPRVAVLINCWVASSGEAVVIGFRERGNTRSFGTATYGLSTSNDEFALTGGGTLVLCTSTMTDRTGRIYGKAVPPDEEIADPNEMVARAIQWLR